MGESSKVKFITCACYVAAYALTYAFVGSLDSAFDAATATGAIARHDAERSLSATFDLFTILGLLSLWVYNTDSRLAGTTIGVLTAFAAGGFHVMGAMGEWFSIAFCTGLMGGSALFVIAKKKPLACTLLAVEVSLAAFQVIFIFVI